MRLWCNMVISRDFPFCLPAFQFRAVSPFVVSPSAPAFVGGTGEPNRASGHLGRWGLAELQHTPWRKFGQVYVRSPAYDASYCK